MATLEQLNNLLNDFMFEQKINAEEALRQLEEFHLHETPPKYQVDTYIHLIEYRKTVGILYRCYNGDIRRIARLPREVIAARDGVGPAMMADIDRLMDACGLLYSKQLHFNRETLVKDALGYGGSNGEITIGEMISSPKFQKWEVVKVIKKLIS